MAKLAPRWKGPYQVMKKTGPVNNEVVLEDTGEDFKIIHVSEMKPWYPTAKQWDRLQQQKIMKIFQEDSDVEDFLGFPTTDPTF